MNATTAPITQAEAEYVSEIAHLAFEAGTMMDETPWGHDDWDLWHARQDAVAAEYRDIRNESDDAALDMILAIRGYWFSEAKARWEEIAFAEFDAAVVVSGFGTVPFPGCDRRQIAVSPSPDPAYPYTITVGGVGISRATTIATATQLVERIADALREGRQVRRLIVVAALASTLACTFAATPVAASPLDQKTDTRTTERDFRDVQLFVAAFATFGGIILAATQFDRERNGA